MRGGYVDPLHRGRLVRERGVVERRLCELEEIAVEREADHVGRDDVVKWSYSWGGDGYAYYGTFLGPTRFSDGGSRLWSFSGDGGRKILTGVYYDDEVESTRGRLFRLVEKWDVV